MKINYNININNIEALAIIFWGRSGSLFLGSLLDNHDSLLTLPEEMISNFYDIDGFWENNKNISKEATILDNFQKTYPLLLKKNLYDEFKYHMIQFSKFNSILNRRNFFISIHYAYELCLKRNVSNKYIINFQMHNSSVFTKVNEFLKDFENAKFLAMYREPIRALNSHVRHHVENVNDFLKEKDVDGICSLYTWKKQSNDKILHYFPKTSYSYTDSIVDGQYLRYYEHQIVGWKKAAIQFKMNFLPVKLELLHDKPSYSMNLIASYLGIKFTDSLLESTFANEKYYGDSRAVQKINGFSSEHTRISNYKEYFNPQDVYVLNNIVSRIHTEYSYLRDDNLSIDKLFELINQPTELESLALKKHMDEPYFYNQIQENYKKRVYFCERVLSKNFSEIMMEGFYR